MNIKKVISDGRLFSVTFKKKNGELRTMLARTGVKKYLRGGVNKNTNPNHVIVFSVHDKGYRTLDLTKIVQLTANGVTYAKFD